MKTERQKKNTSELLLIALLLTPVAGLTSPQSDVFKARRQKLASMTDGGIIIIQSTEKNQDNLLEFYVPDSDNHDFIFLTGLETPGATLILCPGSEDYPEILYIEGDPKDIQKKTEIQNVYSSENLLPDLSNAYTDFSLLRYTQRRSKPLASEIARILSATTGEKIIYFNFPRFVNLAKPPPERLKFIHRFQSYSPKYEIRDVSDLLDSIRMYHDEYGLAQIREAVRISGEAMMECMRSAEQGMTGEQLGAIFNFVSEYQGADGFAFPTTIRHGSRVYREHFPKEAVPMQAGELVTIDAGAEVNHYAADIQRTFPVSGTFSEEQKKIYNKLKKVQEACIRMVRPGVTMKDLQEACLRMLDEEGGYAEAFRWGIGHFLGMEVHDHGNNLIPFKPGIVITIEPALITPNFRVVLEDDVLCTEDGYEWLTEFIPREVEDIERVMKEEGIRRIK